MRDLTSREIQQVYGGRANGAEPDYIFTYLGDPVVIVDHEGARRDIADLVTEFGVSGGIGGGPAVGFLGVLAGGVIAAFRIDRFKRTVRPKVTIYEIKPR